MSAVVLGYGISGKAAAGFLFDRGETVFVYDDRDIELPEGLKSLDGKELPECCDFLIVSPGVPSDHPLRADAAAKGVEVVGEMELAARHVTGERVIAVTGTNGKSTTVTLIHRMLEAFGYKSFLCGNIGTPMTEGVGKGYDFLVVELSSFQLETLESLPVDRALILNVSPDHLDRYDSFDHYADTKIALADLLKKEGKVIVNGGDSILMEKTRNRVEKRMLFSTRGESDIDWDGRFLVFGDFRIDMEKSDLRGIHNVENIMAALLAVSEFGKDQEAVDSVLTDFVSLPHRSVSAGTVKGVKFINDSKATNVGATLTSLRGMEDNSVVLILGGVDKGGSYKPLEDEIRRTCRAVVTIGEAAAVIEEAFRDVVPVVGAGVMEKAVREAFRLSEKGSTVLFAPACSSYDQYPNYKERGDDFCRKVEDLRERC